MQLSRRLVDRDLDALRQDAMLPMQSAQLYQAQQWQQHALQLSQQLELGVRAHQAAGSAMAPAPDHGADAGVDDNGHSTAPPPGGNEGLKTCAPLWLAPVCVRLSERAQAQAQVQATEQVQAAEQAQAEAGNEPASAAPPEKATSEEATGAPGVISVYVKRECLASASAR